MPDWPSFVIDQVVPGLRGTLILSAGSILLSVVLGAGLGLLTMGTAPIRLLVRAYIEFWRAMPGIVTLYFAFFMLPYLNISLPPLPTVILGLSLWGSANIAEVLRGALQSIHGAQREASLALGLRGWEAVIYVIAPQAFKRAVPSIVGIMTLIVQGTSLAVVVGANDLLNVASTQVAILSYNTGNSHAIAIYSAVMAIYFIICLPITLAARRLERRASLETRNRVTT